LKKVQYNNVDINEAFDYLTLISKSICNNKLEKLFYTIYNKYDINDILNKYNTLDKNTKIYEFIVNESIKSSIINVKKYQKFWLMFMTIIIHWIINN